MAMTRESGLAIVAILVILVHTVVQLAYHLKLAACYFLLYTSLCCWFQICVEMCYLKLVFQLLFLYITQKFHA